MLIADFVLIFYIKFDKNIKKTFIKIKFSHFFGWF